jgi:UDPglucose 6-dehydrogenase
VDAKKIELLSTGQLPFFEPGLKELVQLNIEKKRLHFTTDVKAGVKFGEAIFNCVGTPEREDGSADLQYVFQVAEMVAEHAMEYKVLINKSTVPPGTARACREKMRGIRVDCEVEMVSNPEFLKQGNAVYDFNHPDKIVVGAESERAFQVLQKVYHGLLKMYMPIIETNLETAEMIKYANNVFLATKISYVNELANICDHMGADIKTVTKAIGMDQRIGTKFLNAGIGYGGSCFPKDVRAIVSVAKQRGYSPRLFEEVDRLNERQKVVLLPRILAELERVQGDTVTLWGLSFKPKTSDLRGAPALLLLEALLERRMKVRIYDPIAVEDVRKLYGNREGVMYCNSVDESVVGSNVIVLVTEWDEFRNVDFKSIAPKMKSRILFDGRNIYDEGQLAEGGFTYYGLGRNSFIQGGKNG